MLRMYSNTISQPVVSVHTGEKLGFVENLLLEPSSLKIILFEINSPSEKKLLYLRPIDIRFSDTNKLIVDSYQSLSEKEDLVKFKNIFSNNYKLLNKPVFTSENKKLGRVKDFSYDDIQFFTAKLHVSSTILHKLFYESLILDRTEIIETRPDKIIVKDNKAKKLSPKVLPVKSKAWDN